MFTWLSLVMSMMVLNLIESVSEGFPTYFYCFTYTLKENVGGLLGRPKGILATCKIIGGGGGGAKMAPAPPPAPNNFGGRAIY